MGIAAESLSSQASAALKTVRMPYDGAMGSGLKFYPKTQTITYSGLPALIYTLSTHKNTHNAHDGTKKFHAKLRTFIVIIRANHL